VAARLKGVTTGYTDLLTVTLLVCVMLSLGVLLKLGVLLLVGVTEELTVGLAVQAAQYS
jgi:hypothetical protein